MKITEYATLNDGNKMPYLGLGTYQGSPDKKMIKAVSTALEIGYRHIDTAEMYRNEDYVRQGITDSGVDRSEIFITSKVWPSNLGYDSTRQACEKSLERLGTDHLDLYLIHWPDSQERILESWNAMIEMQKNGLIKSIGVSNFSNQHLQDLLENSDVPPSVNQIEFHPFNFRKEIWEFCKTQNIQLEAYSPLTRGERFDHPVVQKAAKTHNKTPAQILTRWAIDHQIVVIPKSESPKRIAENADVFDFELTEEEMKNMDQLDEKLSVI